MTLKKPPPGSSAPPYPLSPTDDRPSNPPALLTDHPPYSPDLHSSPAFDLKPLDEALEDRKMAPAEETGLKPTDFPASLQVGPQRNPLADGNVKRSSSELRRDYQKGEVVEALRPGGGRHSVEAHRAQEVPVVQEQHGYAPPIGSSSTSMDGPAGDYMPFNNPHTAGPVQMDALPRLDVGGEKHLPEDPPSLEFPQPTPHRESAPFIPGHDLSSFDASSTRAYPGQRGAPAVGMDGWKEDTTDLEAANARTWEEECERRANAGAELQRRATEAQRREREEALQAEFWEKEKEEQGATTAPPKPPKADPAGTTPVASNNPWAEEPVAPAREQPSQRPPAVDPATEIYQIKHVNLIPPAATHIHRFPILLQNANGPCPLLALVNAITLSTPPSIRSSLAEVLRLREHVSLSLLLQAVVEELMNRDGVELPDVGDLFNILQTLHTGMNVNPRFVSDDGIPDIHGFEKTLELKLYASFDIPLVHGWLPTPGSAANNALVGCAKSYEDAQTLLVAEEEAISRVIARGDVANPQEEKLMADARIVRDFIESTATQLTPFGLDALRRELPEGKAAILFRNDHFSTVLKRGSQLVALVTDAGFAGHDEVVWETLADVSGRDNAFLSGDFRPVGNNSERSNHGGRTAAPSSQSANIPPPPRREGVMEPGGNTASEQTQDVDFDLAFAMQLQEEENAREEERRRQTDRRPELPPRRGAAPPPREPQPPPGPPPGRSELPPPPYEQAPPPVTAPGAGPQNSAWIESQQRVGRQGGGPHRRGTSVATGPTAPAGLGRDERGERCVVM